MSDHDRFSYQRLLSYLWVSSDSSIQKYACNVYAKEIAMLENLSERLNLTAEERKKMQKLIKWLERLGHAIWINQSDILTNLGIKVGKREKSEDLSGYAGV